jgi:transcriptional regulator of acetoin/glycerol metabolism
MVERFRPRKSAIERAAALATGPLLLPEDLPPKVVETRQSGRAARPSLGLQDMIRGHLRRVLKEARWNKKLAAQLLGIHRRTLYRLTKRYDISRSEPE